jgi:hypothetical protein
MKTMKILMLMSLTLAVGLFVLSCATTEKKTEIPKQEQVTKNLVPPKMEVRGAAFLVELTDLKTVTTINAASKEIVETPTLKGQVKITNKSKDILDIQAVTLEYLDDAGKPIAFKPEEKIVKVYSFWKALQPDATTEGSLDVTLPASAIKNNSLRKIEVSLVYVPSLLKRESLSFSGKVE